LLAQRPVLGLAHIQARIDRVAHARLVQRDRVQRIERHDDRRDVHEDARIQHVAEHDVLLRHPFLFRNGLQLQDAFERDAEEHVLAQRPDLGGVAKGDLGQIVLVRDLEVIDFQKRLQRQFPVAVQRDRPGLGVRQLADVPLRQFLLHLLAQIFVQVERRAGHRRAKDQAVALLHLDLDQTEFGFVDRAEIGGVRHAQQLAVEIVAPTVIRAAEPAGGLAARTEHQRRAAMAAGIDEPLDHAVLGARDQDRGAEFVDVEEVARLRQIARQAGDERQPVEDGAQFLFIQHRVVIGRGVDLHHPVRQRAGASLDVGDQPLGQCDRVLPV